MSVLLYIITVFFWGMILFYSLLTTAGVKQRSSKQQTIQLEHYPSVAVLIPAHNEGVVITDTLRAMSELRYPGKLEIYLLDDQSTDNTAEIVQEFSSVFSHIHYIPVPDGKPKGKSRVLNYGLHISDSYYFAVYDADNQPEPDALVRLVEAAETTGKAAGAVGYVKTKNMFTNVLTRMIGLEFQVFQLLMQSGRWALFKLGSLAGTNMLLKRAVLKELGGYDVHALAEDAELTVRITAAGYLLPVVANSRTFEQEPEKLRTFIKQRTRWLTGNIYLLEKSLHDFSHWKGKTFFLSIQHLMTYLLFVLLLLVSDVMFVIGLSGYEMPNIQVPIILLWSMSYIIYTSHFLAAIAVDRNVSLANIVFVFIMYFTYAQLFILLLLRSLKQYVWSRLKGTTIEWDKTKRFKQKGQTNEK